MVILRPAATANAKKGDQEKNEEASVRPNLQIVKTQQIEHKRRGKCLIKHFNVQKVVPSYNGKPLHSPPPIAPSHPGQKRDLYLQTKEDRIIFHNILFYSIIFS